MEFNIIKRDPYWITDRKVCTFYFQVDKSPKLEKVRMLYLKDLKPGGAYVFFEDRFAKIYPYYKTFIEDTKLGTQFIKEIEKWRRGGSYRKTHPIVLDKLGELRKERDNIAKRKLELDKEIELELKKKKEEEILEYKEDVDNETLTMFLDGLNDLISNKYCLRNLSINKQVYIYDKEKGKYRLKCRIFDDKIEAEDIDPNELRSII